ncbi:MAG: hypothetical protein AAF063_21705 [Cyanobacteria bacterium J06643_5]
MQNRRDLLIQVKSEVNGRLSQSLHNIDPINLQKISQPEKVWRSWDADVKIGFQARESLPPDSKIIDVFHRSDTAGKLLILGEPGSGKTTTLLELAKELVNICENNINDEPIPVLFNLSDWKEEIELPNNLFFQFLPWLKGQKVKQINLEKDPTIAEWLVYQLKEKYGVSDLIGKKWIEERQIIPLLDGLDELEVSRQEKCIQAINQFLDSEYRPTYIVSCCRFKEYENYGTKLELNNAICLQPLVEQQIYDYLESFNYQNFYESIVKDQNLLDLAKSPLVLSIMTMAYENISIEKWQSYKTSKARLSYLFDSYIERMLKRNLGKRWQGRKKPEDRETKYWLKQLATNLKEQSQTEFLIENIQPYWLGDKNQKSLYRILNYLFFGNLYYLFAFSLSSLFLSYLINDSILLNLILSIIAVAASLFSFFYTNEIENKEILKWSWKGIWDNKNFIFLNSLLLSLFFSFFVYKNTELTFLGKLFLITTLVYFPLYGIANTDIGVEARKIPNQGIRDSFKNALISSTIGGLLLGIGNMIITSKNPNIYTLIPVSIGLMIGGFIFGGAACIQHFMLRFILYKHGLIPWNFANFLDYATERLFLQRIGGRYRFMHDLLREHFVDEENIAKSKFSTRPIINWSKLAPIIITLTAVFYIFLSLSFKR